MTASASTLQTPSAAAPIHASRRIPGEIGIWVLIFGDLSAFTVLFLHFMYAKGVEPVLFREAHRHMNQTLGALNTFLMLTSSWLVAIGMQSARRHRGMLSSRLFQGAMACGVAFAVVKYFEYSEKLAAGLTIHSNAFFNDYYMFTIIHLLHVTLGAVMLFLMSRSVRRATDVRSLRFAENGALFWHMVDLLWIVLFALFYLVR
jgi:nitric oxide reductase NorE protein